MYGSKKAAVDEPRDPSEKPLSAPMRSLSVPKRFSTPAAFSFS
jgi:hypothetical protein